MKHFLRKTYWEGQSPVKRPHERSWKTRTIPSGEKSISEFTHQGPVYPSRNILEAEKESWVPLPVVEQILAPAFWSELMALLLGTRSLTFP